jgi:AraC-like DNA-binding protein
MTPDEEPPVRAESSGRDIDHARSMYQDDYNGSGFHAEPTEMPFGFRYTIAGDDELTLRSSMFLGSIHGTVRPQGEYVVSWISDGEGVMDIGGDEKRMERGVPAMFPSGKRFAFHFTEYRQNLIHFDSEFLERVASERSGADPGKLHFDHTSVPDANALVRWNSAVTTAASTVLGTGSTGLSRSEANRLLAETLLDTFVHEAPSVLGRTLPTSHARLAVALEYIHTHAQRAITTTEIAEASSLSLRTLQSTFQAHLGLTPTEYLRGVRLDRARSELLEGEPGLTSVSTTARAWGFAHAGRFAAAYRQRFGEYPGATLER